ncbi:MAG: hypothetical protein NVS1B4_08420 [Gemmatimonadaceae bacterium]
MTSALPTRFVVAVAGALLAVSPAWGQGPGPSSTTRPAPLPPSGPVVRNTAREEAVLRQIKAPEGFKVTPFAGPPVAQYPTCLTNGGAGVLFVCVDPNLSLSTTKGVGRIVRLVDRDGDGIADSYTVFAEVDSPRGVFFDGTTLYVMHPPNLTAYRDTTGDGIADVSEVLVRGLGKSLDFRGADHTTNQITMGIDGWLYIAVGDYSYENAVGKDGNTLRHRGGSVVRVRPDGTGLEMYAYGTRNTYDIAVDPLLHVFARDNTNDGDGWDTRLHYLPAGANMGYPSLYKNFAEEHLPSLADYGAGAGTGGLWVHDPGFPKGFDDMLYTGDWTINKVYRHPLRPRGASFEIEQQEFLSIPHPVDMVMDERSNMYVATLVGGTFTFVGDTVGYVVRVNYPGQTAATAPRWGTLKDAQLLDLLIGPNAEHRLHAQREILRRSTGRPRSPARLRVPQAVGRLEQVTLDSRQPPYARVAAMFTLKQLRGAQSHLLLLRAASDPAIRALALRALTDDKRQLKNVPLSLFVRSLSDSSPVVQVQALTGLVRLDARDVADSIVPLTASADPVVAHLAVNALVSLGATRTALKAVDNGGPTVRRPVLRALQQMHDSTAVAGLVRRYGETRDSVARRDLLHTLARLYHREGPWHGEWWGTRPAFRGPYFTPTPWEESFRIKPLLRQALLLPPGDAYTNVVDDLSRERVLPTGAKPLLLAVSASSDAERSHVVDALVGTSRLDPASLPLLTTLDARNDTLHRAIAQLLAEEDSLTESLLPLARRSALDARLDPKVRAQILSGVSRIPGQTGLDAAVDLFARMIPGQGTADVLDAAWRRYVGDRRRGQDIDHFIRLAQTGSAEQRTLAFAVLLQSIRGPRTPQPVKDKVTPVVDAAWSDQASTPSLVQAITVMKLQTQYEERLKAYGSNAARKAS